MQDFICSCIGIPADICNLLDEIEQKFHLYEFYDIEENMIKVLVHEYGMDKGFHVGNLLILDYYNEIINHYVSLYSIDYPEFNKSLFKKWINGIDSELQFNGEKVEDKSQLDQAILEWILNYQKN